MKLFAYLCSDKAIGMEKISKNPPIIFGDEKDVSCVGLATRNSVEHDMILQPNLISLSRYNAEVVQIKVLFLIVKRLQNQIKRSINQKDGFFLIDFATQEEISLKFKFKEVTPDARRYGEVKKLLCKLPDIIIEIPVKDSVTGKRYKNVGSLIRSVSIPIEAYDTEFIVSLNKDVAAVLLNCKEKGYRELMLQTILNSRSKYTQRLYDIFSGFKKQKEFDINVMTLRDILKLEGAYRYWIQFKTRVLDSAANELKKLFEYNLCDFYFEYTYDPVEKGDPLCIHVTLHLADFALERENHNKVASLQIKIREQLQQWNIYNYGMPKRLGSMSEEQLSLFADCVNETRDVIARQKGAINNISTFARAMLKNAAKKKKCEKETENKQIKEDDRFFKIDDLDIKNPEKQFFYELKQKIAAHIFEVYFVPSGVKIELRNKEVFVRLKVPSQFVADRIEEGCRDSVRDVLVSLWPKKSHSLVYTF